MKTVLVAIKDKKAEISNIYEMQNEGVAVRDFGQTVMRPAPDGRVNMLKDYPADYCLVVLGEFDHSTGKITPLDEPKVIAEASQYAKTE